MGRDEQSLLAGRSSHALGEGEIRTVANTFLGLDPEVPAKHDADGSTRFVVETDAAGEEVGKVYFGPDI